MYLADAVKLKSILRKQLEQLVEEVDRIAFVDLEKGEALPTAQERTLPDVESAMDEVRRDMRTLDRLVYAANLSTMIETTEGEMPLVEAIELATQLRAKATQFQELAARPKREFQYGFEGTTVIRHALYDPDAYRIKAQEVERAAHRISNAINAANYRTEIDFDGTRYM
ncbi:MULTISPECIES: hypothetical protein [Exiguobacterium]|uniref:hypothetical protein n=1 Tax=Exiguobacterium TaxID=33986 RepID=UPI001BE8BCE0|nr:MULTISPECIES: hypothetical protein [Exiguobacterium]MCT4793457.1 hypothetical protein [Exiguobacterium artemiae]